MTATTTLRELFAGKTSKVSGLAMVVMLILSVFATGPVAASSHDFEVTVTDSSGNAIGNASVEIINASDGTVVQTGTTDSAGFYSTTLASGDYDVVVDHADYTSNTQTVTHTSGTLTSLNYSLDRATGTIESTVTDSNGTAIANASVDVIDPSDGSVVATATTDSAGFVSMTVATGTYDVVANADGYDSMTNAGVSVTENTVTTSNFSLSEVSTTGTLEVNVKDNSTGEFLANASVDIVDPSTGTVVKTITTDTNGLASTSIEAGTYDLVITLDGYEQANLSGVDVTADSLTSETVSLTASTTDTTTTTTDDSDGAGSGSGPDGLSNRDLLIGGGVIGLIVGAFAVLAREEH